MSLLPIVIAHLESSGLENFEGLWKLEKASSIALRVSEDGDRISMQIVGSEAAALFNQLDCAIAFTSAFIGATQALKPNKPAKPTEAESSPYKVHFWHDTTIHQQPAQVLTAGSYAEALELRVNKDYAVKIIYELQGGKYKAIAF